MKLLSITELLIASSTAWANTEQLRFEYTGQAHSDPIDLVLRDNRPANSIVHTVVPLAGELTASHLVAVDGVPGETYEVRVCWPASMPTSFGLEWNEELQAINVTYKTESYSADDSIRLQPLPVTYDIVLNRLVLGALPEDIANTIGLVVVAVIAGYFVSRVPYNKAWL